MTRSFLRCDERPPGLSFVLKKNTPPPIGRGTRGEKTHTPRVNNIYPGASNRTGWRVAWEGMHSKTMQGMCGRYSALCISARRKEVPLPIWHDHPDGRTYGAWHLIEIESFELHATFAANRLITLLSHQAHRIRTSLTTFSLFTYGLTWNST